MGTHPETPTAFAGRFELVHEIGRGHQGTVHRAVDRVTGETVALKIFSGTEPPSGKADFLARARVIGTLPDPCLVGYRSAGTGLDGPVLAMEWAPGGRLSDRLKRGRLSLGEALEIGKRVARGLAVLHRAGVAHRNVKPANVLLPEGSLWQAKLSDVWVDLEQPVRGPYDLKLLGASVGFLSPKAVRKGAEEAGPRDDVYSLGALLFRCIAGCMPFAEHDGEDSQALLTKLGARRRISDFVAGLPQELVTLVDALLAEDPAARPENAVSACLALYGIARSLGSYDQVSSDDLDRRAQLSPAFEAGAGVEPSQGGEPPESERDPRVSPDALTGPFVLLERPLDAPAVAPERDFVLAPGDIVAGRFVVEDVAGRGSAGVVYQAKDRDTRDTVALRIFDGAASKKEVLLFLAGAVKAAQRYHPRIVRVLHRGTFRGRMFVAMDWVSGETLSGRLARQPLTMAEALTVVSGAAEGLALLHTLGVVHGRIRPENVLIRNRNLEWVKVADIGVWRRSMPVLDIDVEDAGYVAPEVLATGKTSPSGDVYALGAITFRCLTGKMPFEAADVGALSEKRRQPAPSLASLRPDAPPRLCDLVDSALRTDASARPADAIAFADKLAPPVPLGWGVDNPPPEIVRTADGGRRPVMPLRPPLKPFADVRFQDFVEERLRASCPDRKGPARIAAIAHGTATAGTGTPRCELCGSGPVHQKRRVVEVRDRGYFPQEDWHAKDARPPVICTDCVVEQFDVIDAAVRAVMAEHEGRDGQPVGVQGPTRREVKEGVRALYEAAIPRVTQGLCLSCSRFDDVVKGVGAGLCLRCLKDARAVFAQWTADAPVRRAQRIRDLIDGAYMVAHRRVFGTEPAKPGFEAMPRNGCGEAFSADYALDKLRAQDKPSQAAIDKVTEMLGDALMGHVREAFEEPWGPDMPRSAPGHNGLPRMVRELRAKYRPSPAADARLRLGIAVMQEGLDRWACFYVQNDDGVYADNVTGYFQDFHGMPVT